MKKLLQILCCLLLACSQKDTDNPISTTPNDLTPIVSVTQRIPAIAGGQIVLPNGSYVSIAPGAFPTDTTLTLSLLPSMNKQPPNNIIKSVGPSLMLSFGGVLNGAHSTALSKKTNTPVSGLELVIAYDSIDVSMPGSDPIADVVDLSGNHNFVGVPGIYDSIKNVSTCTVQLSAVGEIGSINVCRANLNPSVVGPLAAEYGPRVWNGYEWKSFPQNFDPTKKTLLVVHGIRSSVESAYSSCIDDIMTAGGYQQVIGFDYDWTKSADQEGALLANFLDTLQKRKLLQIDLQAHSYGGLVSLAALSKSSMKVNNLVTEGSPLSGTPVASKLNPSGISPWLTELYNAIPVVASALSKEKDVFPVLNIPAACKTIEDMYQAGLTNGSVNDLAIGSQFINQVASGPNPPNFIRVVGTKSTWNPLINGLVFGSENGDSYVPSASASGSKFNLPGPPPLYFNDEHVKLECDPEVIRSVGIAVKANPGKIDTTADTTKTDTSKVTPVCIFSISQKSISFDSSGGSGSIPVNKTGNCSGQWATVTNSLNWVISAVTDSATVSIIVGENSSTSKRTGVIAISGNSLSITQTGKNIHSDSAKSAGYTVRISGDEVDSIHTIYSTNMVFCTAMPFHISSNDSATVCQQLIDSMNILLAHQIDGTLQDGVISTISTNLANSSTTVGLTKWTSTYFVITGTVIVHQTCQADMFNPNSCPQSGMVTGVFTFTYTATKN